MFDFLLFPKIFFNEIFRESMVILEINFILNFPHEKPSFQVDMHLNYFELSLRFYPSLFL